MRLLIAEDDPRLLKSLLHIFRANWYAADGVENGTDAYDYASGGEYDGLVLDIMMPGTDGLHVLSRLRAEGVKTPALFLTARAEVSQRVEGLDAGADDYLPKPFSTEELLARVRAMLRRRENFAPELLSFGGAMPLWLSEILSEEKIFRTSFSKYGRAYENICKEKRTNLIKTEETSYA